MIKFYGKEMFMVKLKVKFSLSTFTNAQSVCVFEGVCVRAVFQTGVESRTADLRLAPADKPPQKAERALTDRRVRLTRS